MPEETVREWRGMPVVVRVLNDGPPCPDCGAEMESTDCNDCGGEGETDSVEVGWWDGPLDSEPCDLCGGTGVAWYCPDCLDRARMEEAIEARARLATEGGER